MLNHTSFVKYFGSYLRFSQNHSQSQFLLPWLSSSVKNSSFLWVGLFCPCLQNGCYFIYSEQFFLQISIKLTASLKAMRNSIFFSENSDDVHVILAMDGAAISTHFSHPQHSVPPTSIVFCFTMYMQAKTDLIAKVRTHLFCINQAWFCTYFATLM